MRYEEVVAQVGVIVAEEPQHIEQGTGDLILYVHRSAAGYLAPGCIVGHWLHRFQRVPLAHLAREYEGEGVTEVLTGLIAEGLLAPPKPVDDAAVAEFLEVLQARQDEGDAWADAYEQAQQAALAATWN
jgi:hypothetical protein